MLTINGKLKIKGQMRWHCPISDSGINSDAQNKPKISYSRDLNKYTKFGIAK